jgi:CDP-diacylglycerol---glycerol-3-phosphate 3-phosphatidyltransferase
MRQRPERSPVEPDDSGPGDDARTHFPFRRTAPRSRRPRNPHPRRTAATDRPERTRISELPGPRKQKGMIAPAFGVIFAWPYRLGLAGLYRAGFRPWQLTLLSLGGNAACAWLIVTGRFFLPGILLLPAGLLDIFDGALARQRGEASEAGAFLDSVMDRASDLFVFGALFWALAGQGRKLEAALAVISLVVSLSVSYIRAQAEALGLSITEGLMQRLERYVALVVGLTVPDALLPVLIILTTLGGATVLQRIWSAWQQLNPGRVRASRGRRQPGRWGSSATTS